MNEEVAKIINDYYAGRLVVLDYKTSRTGDSIYISQAKDDNGMTLDFTVYRAEKSTGFKAGYLGTPLLTIVLTNCDESIAYAAALGGYKAL